MSEGIAIWGGSVYVNEPYYSIQFKDSDNNVTRIKYPDEEAFEIERQYYSTPTALNVSFCLERLKNPLPHESFHSLEHVLAHYQQADIGPMEGEYVIDSANPFDACFAELSRIIFPDQAEHGI